MKEQQRVLLVAFSQSAVCSILKEENKGGKSKCVY